jgi:hypothetical protein
MTPKFTDEQWTDALKQAVDRSPVPSPEGGMAKSIVALCEEIDRLHQQLEGP